MKSNRTRVKIGVIVRTMSIIALTIAVVGLRVLRPTPAFAGPASQTQSDMDRLKSLTGEQFEKEFLSMMIQHHQSALDMARYAAQNASHQEVKDTAQNIISAQTQEIGEMTDWLKTWYNTAPQPNAMGEMPGMGMSGMMGLANLKGDDFDKQFLTMMRMHHMSAVEMAHLVPDRATHQELKTLAQNIISSQTNEIQQFESWLMSWYNIDIAGASSGGTMAPGMPGTGGGDGAGLTPWLVLAAALAGSSLVGGLMLRKRS